MKNMLWERVGEIADRAPRIADLRHHKLQLVASARMRETGRDVPPELRFEERRAAAVGLSAQPLVSRVRTTTDAPFLLMKGPEAAARWPSARLRPWKDLDILVEDAEAVQGCLVDAGFIELGTPEEYRELQHPPPLALPGMPLSLEVHRRPHWPTENPPSFAELMEASVPSISGIPDVRAPCPAHHAVLLAGHAWGHEPLSCVGMLADVAALLLEVDHKETHAVVRAWGVERLWNVTERAIDKLLLSRRPPARPPIWQRHLYEGRERTVFEDHLQRLISPVVAAPPIAAPAVATRAALQTVRPVQGERWSEKIERSRLSARHASIPRSDHREELLER